MDHSWAKTRALRALCVWLLALAAFSTQASVAAYDWSQFDGNAQHSGNNTQESFIAASNVAKLQQLFRVALPSIADGAPAVAQGLTTITGTTDVVFETT
jgi:hypothetical protein